MWGSLMLVPIIHVLLSVKCLYHLYNIHNISSWISYAIQYVVHFSRKQVLIIILSLEEYLNFLYFLHYSASAGHKIARFPLTKRHLSGHPSCTFPEIQVTPSRTGNFLHARPTRSTAHFLKFRSPPAELTLSYMPDPPGPLHLSWCSGHPQQN